MSRTFSIACKETKTKLWIGQSLPVGFNEPWRIYAHSGYLEQFARFLTAHAGKTLVFNDDEKLDTTDEDDKDFEEFEDDGKY